MIVGRGVGSTVGIPVLKERAKCEWKLTHNKHPFVQYECNKKTYGESDGLLVEGGAVDGGGVTGESVVGCDVGIVLL
jgi:hypothetical protein